MTSFKIDIWLDLTWTDNSEDKTVKWNADIIYWNTHSQTSPLVVRCWMKLECGLDNRTKQAQSCYRDQRTLNFTNLLCLCQPSVTTIRPSGLHQWRPTLSSSFVCVHFLHTLHYSAAGADAFGLLPQDNTLGRHIHSTDRLQKNVA